MISRIAGIMLAALAASLVGSPAAQAATPPSDPCSEYNAAVESGAKIAVPVVPDRLLANWQDAITCLVPIVGKLSLGVTSPKFTPEAQSKFLSATGAVRTLMTQLSATDDKLKTKILDDLIKKFRGVDNLDVISVLTYAARSDNYDMRLNSVVILGNVIDNTTVCVPLAQLNDPTLITTEFGINGRANLLSIIAVVAPWAYKQNYESIKATRDAIFEAVPKNEPSLAQTSLILDNINSRLTSADNSNKNEMLEPALVADCKKYFDRLNLPDRKNLKY